MSKILLIAMFPFLCFSSMASAKSKFKYFYTLRWEGSIPSSQFELEVYYKNNRKPIIKKKLSAPKYKMKLSRKGRYKWRVREFTKSQKGPFSDFGVLRINDTIGKIDKPLMISPASETVLEASFKNVVFRWEEPKKTWTYQLEIFPTGSKVAVITRTVSGEELILPIEDLPIEFLWRVRPTSSFGNSARTIPLFKVTRDIETPKVEEPKLAAEGPKKDVWIASSAVSYNHTNLGLKVDGVDLQDAHYKLQGPGLHLAAEYVPAKYSFAHSVRSQISHWELTGDGNKLKKNQVSAEYGKKLVSAVASAHWAYFGTQILNLDFNSTQLTSQFQFVYASAGYDYSRRLSEKWRFEQSSKILIPIQDPLILPSVNLNTNFYFTLKHGWMLSSGLIANSQSFRLKGKAEGLNRKTEISLTNFGVSVGVAKQY